MSEVPSDQPSGVPALGAVVAGLLVVAAVAAYVQARGASPLGRLGAGVAIVTLVGVAAGCVGSHAWAVGSAFLIGLFWAWATIALTLQAQFTPLETLVWLGWSFGVVVASVGARRAG